jgi:CheY-like chemotaxis protein
MESERRIHPRAPLLATAVLRDAESGEPIGGFRVVNASAGGLLLEGQPPDLERFEVLLRLSAERAVRAQAVVVPGEKARPGAFGLSAFRVSFVALNPDQEDAIHDAVLSVLEEACVASVLIVDGNVEMCHALRMTLDRMGRRALAVATPLEVVHALEQPNKVCLALVDVALAAGGAASAAGQEVLGYLAESHPAVRRVVMASGLQPWQLDLARGALFPGVHGVLLKPWSDETLSRLLAD